MTPTDTLAAFADATPIRVGPRPAHERRSLIWIAWVGRRLATGALLAGAGVATGNLGIQGVQALAAHVEAAQVAHAAPSPVSRQSSLRPLLAAEHAWATQNWVGAADGWSAWAVVHHDLEAAGWALRAASQAVDAQRIEPARQAWNTVRAQLPPDVQAQVPTLDDLSPDALAPALTPTQAHAYRTLWHAAAGTVLYGQQLGWNQAIVLALIRDRQLDIALAELQAGGAPAWVDRQARSAAESHAHDAGCDRLDMPCDAAPAWPLTQRTAYAQATIAPLQAAGFTPAQAWAMLQERQLLGDAEHTVVNPASPRSAAEQALHTYRTQQQARLAQVHTPAELAVYFASWRAAPVLLTNLTNRHLFGGLQADALDWSVRLRGTDPMGGWIGPDQATLTWSQITQQLATDLRAMPVGPLPAGLTETVARQHLDQAVHAAGLAELRWSVSVPATPEVLWRLGDQILAVNRALEHRTGWRGGVLGLGGRVRWHIEARPVNATYGEMLPGVVTDRPATPDEVTLLTVADARSTGPIAHEWTHALAHVNGHVLPGQPALIEGAEDIAADDLSNPFTVLRRAWWHGDAAHAAWAQLWQTLRSPPLDAADREESAMRGWYSETARLTGERARALGDLADLAVGQWRAPRAQARWASSPYDPTQLHGLLNDVLQAQRADGDGWHPGGVGITQSPWMRINLAMDATADPHYLARITEQVARSGEAAFFAQGELARPDIQSWLTYPSERELAWQTQAWDTFFAQMAPWWAQQRQPPAPLDTTTPAVPTAAALSLNASHRRLRR